MNELIRTKAIDARALAEVYAQDDGIISALSSKNRDQISKVIDPLFSVYSNTTGISVFEVGDKDGIVFYRGHNPGKNGDDKSGKATISSALSGNIIAGTETGSSGIAIRAFAPIKSNGKTIGTMQIGFSDQFFLSYQEIADAKVQVFNKEKLLYTTDTSAENTIGMAIDEFDSDIKNAVTTALNGEEVSLESSSELKVVYPILEPANSSVIGTFIVSYDISGIMQNLNMMLITNGLIILVIIIVTLITLNYFKKNISSPLTEVTEILNKMSVNDFTEYELKYVKQLESKDEVGQLYRAIAKLSDSVREIIKTLQASATNITEQSQDMNRMSESGARSLREINLGFDDFTKGIQHEGDSCN